MNWRRGLFRVWIVLSVAWVIVIGYADDLPCTFGVRLSAPWCAGYGRDPYVWQYAWKVHLLAFGIPIAALVVGAGIGWALNGFRATVD